MKKFIVLLLLCGFWVQPAQADRLFTSGFELNANSTIPVDLSNWSCNDSPLANTTADRSGLNGLHISALTSATVKGCRAPFKTSSATSSDFARAYVRFVTLPSATMSTILAFTPTDFTTTTVRVGMRVDNAGVIEIYDEDGQVGTDCETTVSTGTWYRFELHVDGSPAAGSDVVEFKIDGTTQSNCSASNRTLDNAWRDFFVGGNRGGEAQTTGEWYIDDVAVNNNAGSSQTSYPGAGSVGVLFVDADGDTTNRGSQGTDWDTCTNHTSPCTVGTGGTMFQQVDESPTPDDSTSEVFLITDSTSSTDPPVLQFGVGSLSGSATATSLGVAIDSDDTITYLAPRVRVGAVSGASTTQYVTRIVSSSAVGESGTYTANANTNTNWEKGSTNPNYTNFHRYTDPNTSAAWTLSAADAVEVGIRSTETDPDIYVTWIGIEFEWVAVAGGGGGSHVSRYRIRQK